MTYVTLTDAARQLGVAPSTLRHQIRLKRLSATKVGPRRWFVASDEVERYRAEVQRKG